MSDISQCLHIKNLVQSFGPKVKFVQFYISPGRFGKVLCSSANEFQQNSNSIYSTNIDCFVIDSSCLHLTCLSFVTNSWNHLKYFNFLSLSGRSSSLWTISMQQQGVRKYGCFHKLYRAKLQWNAWGMPGGRWAVLELTGSLKINKSPLSDIVRLPFQGGKLLSLALF